ncbi:hypothetical protein TNCV_3045611 [Trichonephila clavipes]|uniref:Uncharacterized protein n=1 Tax=Trichonephila clavipes TaxID=2585209 RepID=A0A8X6RM14_TRICX|nr:hypothetical protein TNCV_3045611 [Trichonephila clavipes]
MGTKLAWELNTGVSFYTDHLIGRSAHASQTCGDSLERQNLKNAWNKLWSDLEGEKDFNNDHREEITDFAQSIQGFQEYDEEDI